MMIYREMPPLGDLSFRESFYTRWGRESAAISATAHRAQYPDYTQLLSVKMATGGSEDYFVDGRRIRVDDDTFLILNEGRRYGSLINALQPVHSFSVFFRPGLAQEVQDALCRPPEAQLADPAVDRSRPPEFDERLREHDTTVTPVLRHIQRVIDAGESDDGWLEEQLHFLIGRMLRLEGRRRLTHELIACAKPATRRELHRRVGLAVTFIHTHYCEPIGLRDIARAAHLSPFHFLRTFKAVYGITPSMYLNHKRTAVALRLVRKSGWTLTEIAEVVGFGNRTTLFRHLRASGQRRFEWRLRDSEVECSANAKQRCRRHSSIRSSRL
jgi:AraC-like DNA-binding protein